MMVASAARRPARPAWLVLLAAALTALGLAASLHGGAAAAATPQPWGADVAVDGSSVTVVAPVRSVGRLAAEPSLLGVHGPGEPVPFGTLPAAVPPPLMRLADRHISVTPRLRAAQRPTAGDRAPPLRPATQ